MKIGMISYLPPEPELRKKRARNLKNTFEWLDKEFPGVEVRCVAQNHALEDLHKDTYYYFFREGIGAAKSRNILLKDFYETDDDWMLLLDDDCTLYDYYGWRDLIKLLNEEPECTTLDAIGGVDPTRSGFRWNILQKRDIFEHNFTFKRDMKGMQFLLLRNLKKKYNKEIYFTEQEHVHEDVIFLKELQIEGFRVAASEDMIYKLDTVTSTIFTGDQRKEHLLVNILTYQYLFDKYEFEYDRGEINELLQTILYSSDSKSYKDLYDKVIVKRVREFNKQTNPLLKMKVRDLDIPRPEVRPLTDKESKYNFRPRS